jgi:hypothetical protein
MGRETAFAAKRVKRLAPIAATSDLRSGVFRPAGSRPFLGGDLFVRTV